ncbi:MAG TPA: 23S rRNA (guanosine(2251)-2'-O)-methyltransferase RlmB [Thermoanaerobaculia bacterium]|nr:23S rRNA (guanosine(2251)-2'-O)-methyltransferase RlmB [Thermoanaerobaculia bacterium]
MIVYGANPVLEALRAHPERVRWVAVSREGGRRGQRIVEAAREAGVAVRFPGAKELARLAGGGVHNGVVAEVSSGAYAGFEEAVAAAEVVFLLDGITDPQNLGAILRVADAFGVDLIVIPEHDSAGLTPAAVKASAGAAEWVRVAQVTNLARAIERLKREEFWIWGAAADGEPADRVDLRGKTGLVLGSEGKGIRRNVLEHCDGRVAIPMQGHVGSLNVAAAAAVLAYELRRQRGKD